MTLFDLLQVLTAILYGNFLEWALHKYVLHGYGRDKGSFWSDHYHVHHVNYLKYHGHDPNYERIKINSEIVGLVLLGLLHLPLSFMAPIFYFTLVAHGVLYYAVHRQAHCDSHWGWRWIPWHMQHHQGGRLDGNWCVIFPLWDYIMRTRVKPPRRVRATKVDSDEDSHH